MNARLLTLAAGVVLLAGCNTQPGGAPGRAVSTLAGAGATFRAPL